MELMVQGIWGNATLDPGYQAPLFTGSLTQKQREVIEGLCEDPSSAIHGVLHGLAMSENVPVSMLCVYVVHFPLSLSDVLSRQWRNYCMCLYNVTACKNYCGSRDIMIIAGHSSLAAQDEAMVPMASSRCCGCICVCYWHIPVLSVTPWT